MHDAHTGMHAIRFPHRDRNMRGSFRFRIPLLNSLLKTTKKINVLILIAFIQILILFYKFSAQCTQPEWKFPCFYRVIETRFFSSIWPINTRIFKRLFYNQIVNLTFPRGCGVSPKYVLVNFDDGDRGFFVMTIWVKCTWWPTVPRCAPAEFRCKASPNPRFY